MIKHFVNDQGFYLGEYDFSDEENLPEVPEGAVEVRRAPPITPDQVYDLVDKRWLPPEPKHYVDADGVYLGSYSGAEPPEGAVEVPEAPADVRQVCADNAWQPLGLDVVRGAMPTLTARQFRLGLINAGITLQEVDDQIALIADPAEKSVAEIEWTYASTFERLHPLVVTVSLALNLTPEQVDSLWTWAADL